MIYRDSLQRIHKIFVVWILDQAGIAFDAKAEPGKLRGVAA